MRLSPQSLPGLEPASSSAVRRKSRRLRHSTLVPDNLMTFSHFSVSDRTNVQNSSGLAAIGVAPSSASRDLIFGEASPALISRFSLPTISADVPCGAPTPYQMIASYPGTLSAMVGRLESTCDRVAVVTPSARSLPD